MKTPPLPTPEQLEADLEVTDDRELATRLLRDNPQAQA